MVQECTVTPVHEVNVDSGPTAQLLHEGGGRDGDRGPVASEALHSAVFRGLENAFIDARGGGGHSVRGKTSDVTVHRGSGRSTQSYVSHYMT